MVVPTEQQLVANSAGRLAGRLVVRSVELTAALREQQMAVQRVELTVASWADLMVGTLVAWWAALMAASMAVRRVELWAVTTVDSLVLMKAVTMAA